MMRLSHAAMLSALVGTLLYINTLDCGLCFDDEKAIIQNKDLRTKTPWSNLLWNDFWGVPMSSGDSHKSYRPLCVATFRLNYLFHELQPMSYHLVNILLHGAVCYLYVQLCGLVFSQVWPALIAGLLFAVHPIHTEAVAGVVGRADVMASVFFLACVLIYWKAAQSQNGYYKWLTLSVVLCTCSALSKETGLTAVAVCLTLDFLFIQHLTLSHMAKLLALPQGKSEFKGQHNGFVRRVVLLAAYVVGFMSFRLQLMKGQPNFGYQLNPARLLPSPYRQLHWSYLSAFNSWLLLNPSLLIPEYAMNTIPLIVSLSDPRNLLTLVTMTTICVLVVFGLFGREQEHRVTMFGLSLIVFPYLPASNLFFPVGFVVAERVLYLPSMGTSLLVAYGAWKMIKQSKKHFKMLAVIGTTILLLTQSTKTLTRNRDWKDEVSLYTSAIRTTPHNAKMAHNLGAEYGKMDDPKMRDIAIGLMQLSMSTEPLYISPISDLGYLYQLKHRPLEAEQMYKRGIELVHQALDGNMTIAADVKNLKLFTRLSKLLRKQKRYLESEIILTNVTAKIPLQTHYPNIFVELAEVYTNMGDTDRAKVYIDKALSQDRKHTQAHVALARVYVKLEVKGQAERVLKEAIKSIGMNSLLVYELGAVLASYHDNQNKLKEAENLLVTLINAQPTNADAIHQLGLVYYDLKQYDDAHKLFLRALQLEPKHTGALFDIGRLYVAANECKHAREKLGLLLELEPENNEGRRLLGECTQQTTE